MSKIWDEREKTLENEYFRRKEQELIEKLRARRAEAEHQKTGATAALQCPKCDGTLVEIDFGEVQIDRCTGCHGVWLDAGELERLTAQESGWLKSFWKSLAG